MQPWIDRANQSLLRRHPSNILDGFTMETQAGWGADTAPRGVMEIPNPEIGAPHREHGTRAQVLLVQHFEILGLAGPRPHKGLND